MKTEKRTSACKARPRDNFSATAEYTAHAPSPDKAEIRKALDALFEPSDIIELRIFHKGRKQTDAGYFDDAHRDKLVEAAARLNTTGAAAYMPLNRLDRQLLSRYSNRIQCFASATATDANITRRRWLLVDFDPIRPKDTSATDKQKNAAIASTKRCYQELRAEGWPNPIVADSGNGAHLLYPLDLPNDKESTKLVKGALAGLALRFDSALVTVDTSVANAARLIKLYGSVANKGDHTESAPWRLSKLASTPARSAVVTIEQLRALHPSSESEWKGNGQRNYSSFDLDDFLTRLGIEYTHDIHENRDRYRLAHCPFDASHGIGEAAILRGFDGVPGFNCFHNSCQDKTWHDVRALVEEPSETRTKAPNAKKSETTVLLEQVEVIPLFQNDDDAYGVLPVNGHTETWPLASEQFRSFITRKYYLLHRRAPGVKTIDETLRTLSAKARFECPECPVHRRIAEQAGVIYIDLCDPEWRAIKVTPLGWQTIDQPPVRFIRSPGMQAIREPRPNEGIHALWDYINVASEETRQLIVAWLVAALRPTGPYPILILQGEEGTGKSTCAKLLRTLVDPSAALLRSIPRNEHELMLSARNSWIISLNNLSGLRPWLSDALCRITSDGGFATRRLYCDTEEVIINVQRPVILNGIDDIATRQDLISRAIIINLDRIPASKQRDEEELFRAFHAAQPAILGGLLNRVCQALQDLPTTHLVRKPRMADFALWATAAEPPEEKGRFLKAYRHNRKTAVEVALESSPVAVVLREMLVNMGHWEGTATELLSELASRATDPTMRHRSWPRSAEALGTELRRLASALRKVRVKIDMRREAGTGKRIMKITKICKKRRGKKSSRKKAAT